MHTQSILADCQIFVIPLRAGGADGDVRGAICTRSKLPQVVSCGLLESEFDNPRAPNFGKYHFVAGGPGEPTAVQGTILYPLCPMSVWNDTGKRPCAALSRNIFGVPPRSETRSTNRLAK